MIARKWIFGIGIGCIIAAGLFVFLYRSKQRHVASPQEQAVSVTKCFARVQKATPEAPYAVTEHIKLAISNNSVSGTKEGTQSGPDMTNGYQGTLSGVIHGSELELVYSYTVEGSQNKELEVYDLTGDTLVKNRWPLVDQGGILTPDRSSIAALISYTATPCAD